MDFKTHLEKAWTLTLKYVVPLILMTLVMLIAGILTLGILLPVMKAGYMQSVLMMVRSGREPRIQDLFSEMGLFLPLLGFGLSICVLLMIGFSLLVLPGILIICGITYVCLYMLPLMTDRKFGILDAIKESFTMVTAKDFMDHIITAILVLGIVSIGGSTFIGLLFVMPLATVFLMIVYEEKTGINPPQPPAPEPVQPEPAEDDGIRLKYKP